MIGVDRVEALENDNTPHKWTIDEAKAVIEQHKQLIKEFDHDGTGAPGLRNPVHAGTPSPINGLDGRAGNERLRKQANNGSVAR